jgi:hypothetical protein
LKSRTVGNQVSAIDRSGASVDVPDASAIQPLPSTEDLMSTTHVAAEITLVAPNGANVQEKYRPHDTVGKTLEHAVKQFGKTGDLDPNGTYILVKGESPLENSLTLEKAGIKPGDSLKIRAKGIPVDGHARRAQ